MSLSRKRSESSPDRGLGRLGFVSIMTDVEKINPAREAHKSPAWNERPDSGKV